MAVLPFDQRDGFIWMNGELVPWKEAKLHVLSHGLHYASCVFEGERAYGGVVFKSREHSERFKRSAEFLDFDVPYSVAELDAAKQLVVDDQEVRRLAANGVLALHARCLSGESEFSRSRAAMALRSLGSIISSRNWTAWS